MPREQKLRVTAVHPLQWVIDPLASEPTLVTRPMFGARAVYLEGRLVLVLCAQAEPWRGVLLPTERVHHGSLIAERPALAPHAILPKWLYLPEAAVSFERDAAWAVARIRARDERLGIVPPAKRSAAKTKRIRFGDPL